MDILIKICYLFLFRELVQRIVGVFCDFAWLPFFYAVSHQIRLNFFYNPFNFFWRITFLYEIPHNFL